MKPALLIIDMQNDFVSEGGIFEIKRIRENIKAYKNFIDKFRQKDCLVIYTRHNFDPKKNPIEAKLFPELKERGLRQGSFGWQIYKEIEPRKGDRVIDKSRYDAFFGTELNNYLLGNKIDTLIITGTMTEVCCESTARSAMYLDYNVIFCSDFTYASDKEKQNNTLNVISRHFGGVESSDEILKNLNIN